MTFTDADRAKLSQEPLRPYCVHTDGRYLCKVKVGKIITSHGKFDTIDECNAEHDRIMKAKLNH